MKLSAFFITFLNALLSLNSPILADTSTCNYEQTQNGYTCTLTLNSNVNQIIQISGFHRRRQRDHNVQTIKISEDNQFEISTFSATFCNKFKNLKIIDMSNTKIETIHDGSLNQCKSLEIFRIDSNDIEELPEDLLAENKKLQKLYLNFNYIKELPDNFLSELGQLTILDLSYNKFNQLPSGAFNDLENLKELNLEGNKLKELNQNLFKNVKNLEKINFNENEISELPIGIFASLRNLNSLSMQNNKLTVIHSASFPQQAQIDIVSFSYNKINSIDEAFINNCRVNSLKMAGNVCDRNTQIRSHQMRDKLKNCYKNYRDSYAALKLKPWIQGCGKAKLGTQTIIRGTKVDKGSYPWIAALMHNENGYFCGGTLVSKRLVVTAGHCVVDKQREISPEDLIVVLGAHQLNSPFDIGKRSYGVKTIHPHNNWNPHTTKFDSDIAVLKLSEDVAFSPYIQPVCLSYKSSNLESFTDGIVVGFGRTENSNSHSNIPLKANTPIRSKTECYSEFPGLLNLASANTFCGGYANGTGACTGDSGGGLTVVQDEVHYLRGIVSASLQGEYGCDVNSYSLFTDIRFYLNFIKKFNN